MADDSFTANDSAPSTIPKYILLIIVGFIMMLGMGMTDAIPYMAKLGVTAGVIVLGAIVIESTKKTDTKF